MSVFLLIAYVLILSLQIFLLVKAVRKKKSKNWLILIAIEVGSMIAAREWMIYYDELPGYGFMPGLTYIGHFLFSMVASYAYGIALVITLITWGFVHFREKRKKRCQGESR